MKKYKYLLFDADNTLFDFNRSEHEALSQTFSVFGISLDDDQRNAYHRINDDLWKKLELGEITRDELKVERFAQFVKYLGLEDISPELLAAEYVNMLSLQSFLLPGAMDLCERLYRVYPLYLITNGITQVQEKRFAASPIKKYFTDIFISEKMGVAKPSVEYFQKVSDAVGDNDPYHYLVIGDSLSSDIKGAVNFGCDSIWIAPEGSYDPRPTYIVNELNQIDRILL